MKDWKNGARRMPLQFYSRKPEWVLFIIFLVFFLNNCNVGPPAPERSFKPEDLLLTEADVPRNWHLARIAPLGPSAGYGDEDDREAKFTRPGDDNRLVFAFHDVLQFDSISEAVRWYRREQPAWFNDNRVSVDEPWMAPPELSYHSSLANQFYAACTINNIAGRKKICSIMAQYEEFVIIFHSGIEPDWISVAGFNELVRRIDEIMVAHLQTG
jgi:hypothetical protein